MIWQYPEASDGTIALTGAIDLAACGGQCALALGFGRTEREAGRHTRGSVFRQIRFELLFSISTCLSMSAAANANSNAATDGGGGDYLAWLP